MNTCNKIGARKSKIKIQVTSCATFRQTYTHSHSYPDKSQKNLSLKKIIQVIVKKAELPFLPSTVLGMVCYEVHIHENGSF